MAQNYEVAKIVLNTNVFSPYTGNASVTNAYGTCNAGKTSCTFAKIPLQSILGEMYDKYEKFNLVVASWFIYQIAGTMGNSVNDRCVNIQMSGLPFVTGYNCISTNPGFTQSTIIGSSIVGTSSQNQGFGFPISFYKNNSPYVDITIDIVRASDGAYPTRLDADFSYNTVLTIYGIDEPKQE